MTNQSSSRPLSYRRVCEPKPIMLGPHTTGSAPVIRPMSAHTRSVSALRCGSATVSSTVWSGICVAVVFSVAFAMFKLSMT